jgi:hypothetical protein
MVGAHLASGSVETQSGNEFLRAAFFKFRFLVSNRRFA